MIMHMHLPLHGCPPPRSDQSINLHLALYFCLYAEMLTALISSGLAISSVLPVNTFVMNEVDTCDLGA